MPERVLAPTQALNWDPLDSVLERNASLAAIEVETPFRGCDVDDLRARVSETIHDRVSMDVRQLLIFV